MFEWRTWLWPSQHRIQQKIIVLTCTRKTQLHLSPVYFNCWRFDSALQNHWQCQSRSPKSSTVHLGIVLRQFVLRLLLSFPLPFQGTSQFTPSHFRFHALWLAAFYYANPLFLWEYHFLLTPVLFMQFFRNTTRAQNKALMHLKHRTWGGPRLYREDIK